MPSPSMSGMPKPISPPKPTSHLTLRHLPMRKLVLQAVTGATEMATRTAVCAATGEQRKSYPTPRYRTDWTVQDRK